MSLSVEPRSRLSAGRSLGETSRRPALSLTTHKAVMFGQFRPHESGKRELKINIKNSSQH
jgi:hypothetical protein